MAELRLDYLPETAIALYQRDDMFKINTDTHLLGTFMKAMENDVILDIGCNNGALLLYASRYRPRRLIGVEILKEACELAELNLSHNKIQDYEIIYNNIKNVVIEPVDVIVCNPPYEKENASLCPNNIYQEIARCERYLKLEELIAKVGQLLKDNGRFYMIHRSSRINEIVALLAQNRLAAEQLEFIFDRRSNASTVVLISACKNTNVQCCVTYRNLGEERC